MYRNINHKLFCLYESFTFNEIAYLLDMINIRNMNFQGPNLLSNYTGMNPMSMIPQPPYMSQSRFGPQYNQPQYGPQQQYAPPPQQYGPQPQQPSMMSNMSSSMNNAYANARMGMSNATKNKSLILGAMIFCLLACIILLFMTVLSFADPTMIGFDKQEEGKTSSNLIVGMVFFILGSVVTFGLSVILFIRMRKLASSASVMPAPAQY
jgi:hypothetical protein